MGVPLTPIVAAETLTLDALRGHVLAVDGNGELYQFLALIRLRDGTPLRDSTGRTTSHLAGLFYRTMRLIAEYGLKLVFVFDGTPPPGKTAELEKRRAIRQRYEAERDEALRAGDLRTAYSKSTMTSRLTREMVGEARTLLRLLGIPSVQAPSEAEAQAAHMAKRGDAWAATAAPRTASTAPSGPSRVRMRRRSDPAGSLGDELARVDQRAAAHHPRCRRRRRTSTLYIEFRGVLLKLSRRTEAGCQELSRKPARGRKCHKRQES